VPVLARKPGALRNGAPFKDWVPPASMERVRRKLATADDGNRQMVDILTAVLSDGLPAVEAATAQRRSGRWDRNRQDSSGHCHRQKLYPRRLPWPVLQRGRSRQPARDRDP